MGGRGKSARNQHLIATARDILEEIQPASVRAVCYRLFIVGEIPSMSTRDTKRVSEQLVDAREQDLIPWEWITDSTRSAEGVSVFEDPEDYAEVILASYRRNFWQGQSVRLQVWSEKATVRGAVEPVLRQYAVRFRFVHGFNSATVVREIAEESQMDPPPAACALCRRLGPFRHVYESAGFARPLAALWRHGAVTTCCPDCRGRSRSRPPVLFGRE